MLPVRLHGRAAPISALQVSAQGCVFVHLVEMLLDPLLPEVDKRAEQRRYQQQHGVGERSIRGYLLRYRTRGPRSLLFYRPRPTSARVHDAALREKLLELINELPTRSVPQLRKLIAADARLGAKIARISDRTLYRFLADHDLTMSARYRLLADDQRTSFRSFEAPHALALVQDCNPLLGCAVERRCVPAGANPARQLSFQPEAVGAVQGGNELD